MDFAKIRPRGGTKAQWEKANPVLAKREIGVQWETTIGVGEVVIKIGDGVNNWINLPEAVKSDITKKIIAALAVVPDDDPDLADGDSLDTLFGKIAKKFKYLKDNKLDKSARYDGTDSTSTELVPTANALRGVNAKADKNASDITTLNNNLSKRFAINNTENTYNALSDLPETGSGFGTTTTGLTLYDGFKIPTYSRICFMNYGGSKDGAIFAIDGDGKTYTAFRNNGTWHKGNSLVSKDDLGVAEYNAGKSIKISGRLSDIGKWLQTNGTTSQWMSVRANPTNTDGYFGSSTFSILWQCSSANYGWCILMSDNTKMVVLGRNSEGWHWYAPSLTEVS